MKLTLGSNNCGRLAACTPKLAKTGCEAAPIQHRTDWLWRTGRQLQDKIDIYFRRVSVRGRNVGMTANAMYGCALQNASFEITTIRRRLTGLPHSVRTPAALRPEMKVPIPRSLQAWKTGSIYLLISYLKEDTMANVVGTWSLTTDWGCDGSITGSFNQTFNADGTWSSTPFVHNGRWYQVEGLVVWTFSDTQNLVYAANLSGSWMAGVQGYETSGGSKGCFGGHRAGVAAAAETAMAAKKVKDPSIGK